MNDIKEVLTFLDLLRESLKNFTESELEDIANVCQDICDDIDSML